MYSSKINILLPCKEVTKITLYPITYITYTSELKTFHKRNGFFTQEYQKTVHSIVKGNIDIEAFDLSDLVEKLNARLTVDCKLIETEGRIRIPARLVVETRQYTYTLTDTQSKVKEVFESVYNDWKNSPDGCIKLP